MCMESKFDSDPIVFSSVDIEYTHHEVRLTNALILLFPIFLYFPCLHLAFYLPGCFRKPWKRHRWPLIVSVFNLSCIIHSKLHTNTIQANEELVVLSINGNQMRHKRNGYEESQGEFFTSYGRHYLFNPIANRTSRTNPNEFRQSLKMIKVSYRTYA